MKFPGSDNSRYFGPRELIFAALLTGLTLLSYRPVWHGTPVWDDNTYLTPPDLASTHGLVRIWTEFGATYQYYPVLDGKGAVPPKSTPKPVSSR